MEEGPWTMELFSNVGLMRDLDDRAETYFLLIYTI